MGTSVQWGVHLYRRAGFGGCKASPRATVAHSHLLSGLSLSVLLGSILSGSKLKTLPSNPKMGKESHFK